MLSVDLIYSLTFFIISKSHICFQLIQMSDSSQILYPTNNNNQIPIAMKNNTNQPFIVVRPNYNKNAILTLSIIIQSIGAIIIMMFLLKATISNIFVTLVHTLLYITDRLI